MGNYIIVVCGAGPHDNNKAFDVEQLTARFVADLRDRGHSIADVHMSIGSAKRLQKDLAPVADALPPMADALEDLDRDARGAYERYFVSAGGKTFDGRPMPDWEKLTPEVQKHWNAAVDFYDVTKVRQKHVIGESNADAVIETAQPPSFHRDLVPTADETPDVLGTKLDPVVDADTIKELVDVVTDTPKKPVKP